jgi:hypothetical protein
LSLLISFSRKLLKDWRYFAPISSILAVYILVLLADVLPVSREELNSRIVNTFYDYGPGQIEERAAKLARVGAANGHWFTMQQLERLAEGAFLDRSCRDWLAAVRGGEAELARRHAELRLGIERRSYENLTSCADLYALYQRRDLPTVRSFAASYFEAQVLLYASR